MAHQIASCNWVFFSHSGPRKCNLDNLHTFGSLSWCGLLTYRTSLQYAHSLLYTREAYPSLLPPQSTSFFPRQILSKSCSWRLPELACKRLLYSSCGGLPCLFPGHSLHFQLYYLWNSSQKWIYPSILYVCFKLRCLYAIIFCCLKSLVAVLVQMSSEKGHRWG